MMISFSRRMAAGSPCWFNCATLRAIFPARKRPRRSNIRSASSDRRGVPVDSAARPMPRASVGVTSLSFGPYADHAVEREVNDRFMADRNGRIGWIERLRGEPLVCGVFGRESGRLVRLGRSARRSAGRLKCLTNLRPRLANRCERTGHHPAPRQLEALRHRCYRGKHRSRNRAWRVFPRSGHQGAERPRNPTRHRQRTAIDEQMRAKHHVLTCPPSRAWIVLVAA